MRLTGIPLRRPDFGELTARRSWPSACGSPAWARQSTRLGIRVGSGQRHLEANLLVSGALLGLHEAVRAVAA